MYHKQRLLNPDQLYESIVVHYTEEATKRHQQSMLKAETTRDKKALEQAYKARLEPIIESHMRIWMDATLYNKCFTFGHPHINSPRGKKGKRQLAQALREDEWWVIRELTDFKLGYNNPCCGTEGCMNPLHWKPKNIRKSNVIPNIKGLLLFYPELETPNANE